MNITFYFRKSLGNKKAAAGFGTLNFYLSNKVIDKSTEIRCHQGEFNSEHQIFVGPESAYKNKLKDDILFQFKRCFGNNQQSTVNEQIELFLQSLQKPRLKFVNFSELLEEFLLETETRIRHLDKPRTEHTIEMSTFGTYKKRKKNVIDYLAFTKNSSMNIADCNHQFLNNLQKWLVNTPNLDGQSRGQAYATKHLKLLKSAMKFAVAQKYIQHDATYNFRYVSEPTTKNTIALKIINNELTFDSMATVNTIDNEDLEKLRNYEYFTPTEQKYVDAFLLMREMWLHIKDYQELKDDNFQIDSRKNCWYVKPREKRTSDSSGQIQILPLSENALNILNKYDTNYNGAFSKLPKAHPNTVIHYVRIACRKVGIEKYVTLKYARSNGISNCYNFTQAKPEEIAIGAGWTTIKQLTSYWNPNFERFRKVILNVA